MTTHTVTTNLKGLRKWAWRKNLAGFFSYDGRELSDAEVRAIVEYGIEKGYETEADIPGTEIDKILKEI